MQQSKENIIDHLKKEILKLGGFKSSLNLPGLPEGLKMMHKHFPQGSFPLGAIHEFLCIDAEDTAATGGFISGVLSTCLPTKGIVVWISLSASIFSPALKLFNIEPHKILFVHPANEKEILWVMEEALKCDSLVAVVSEMRDLNFTNSRRFQLAVEKSKVTGFILNQKPGKVNTSACLSRWRIKSLPSQLKDGMPGVGAPRWNLELLKIRNGKPGSWQVEWAGSKFRPVYEQTVVYQEEKKKAV